MNLCGIGWIEMLILFFNILERIKMKVILKIPNFNFF